MTELRRLLNELLKAKEMVLRDKANKTTCPIKKQLLLAQSNLTFLQIKQTEDPHRT